MGDASGEPCCFGESGKVGASLLSMFSDYFGIGLIAPLLPFWLKDQGFSLRWVGTIIFAQYIATIFGLPFFGAESKRFGVERTLLFLMVADSALFWGSGHCWDALSLAHARHPELFLVPNVAMENTYRPSMPVGPVYATLSLGGVEPFAFLITD